MTALDLDPIRARLAAATPGPWENDGGGEVGQHWSSPQPLASIVSTEVSCMAYCYGGSAAGVIRDEDADFIAHAPTDIAALLAEVERLRKHISIIERRCCDGCVEGCRDDDTSCPGCRAARGEARA